MKLPLFPQQDIKIDVPGPLINDLNPPQLILNSLERSHQLQRWKRRLDHAHSVQEVVLIFDVHGCRLEEAAGGADTYIEGFHLPTRSLDPMEAVTHVTAEGNDIFHGVL